MFQIRSAAEHHLVFNADTVSPAAITAMDALLYEPIANNEFCYQLNQEQRKLAWYLLTYRATTLHTRMVTCIHDERVNEDVAEAIVDDWDLYFSTEGVILQSLAHMFRDCRGGAQLPTAFEEYQD